MSSIRLKHASGNSMSLAAPGTNPASNLELKLPHTIGSANQLLKVDGSGQLGWATDSTTDSTKLPLAGGTLTGNVLHNDGVKDIYGTNSDLQIYHDSSSGQSKVEVRNHNLFFEAINQNEIMFTHDGGYMLRMTPDGEVKLFHNGNEKLNTFVNGVTVTGNLYATNAIFVDDSGDNGTSDFIGVGLGKDLKMYHNSSHSFIQNSTGTLYVKSDTISFNKLDGTNLFWSNGSEMRMYPGGNQEFTLDSNGKVDINNGTGQAHYQITQTNGNTVKFGIVSGSDIELSGTSNNNMIFKTNNAEKFRITSSSATLKGTTDGVLNLDTTDSRGSFIRFQQGTNTKVWVGCGQGLSAGGVNDLGLLATSNIIMRANGSERLRITSDGLLGLGLSAPTQAYGIDKTLHIHSSATSGNRGAGLHLTSNSTGTTSTDGARIAQVETDLMIYNHENSAVYIGTNGSEKVQVTATGGVQLKNTACNRGIIWIHDGEGGNACTGMANVQQSGGRGIVNNKMFNIAANTTTDFAKSHWGGLILIGWSGTGYQGTEQVMFGYNQTPSSRYKAEWVGTLSVTYTMSAYTLRISHNGSNALNFWCILIGV